MAHLSCDPVPAGDTSPLGWRKLKGRCECECVCDLAARVSRGLRAHDDNALACWTPVARHSRCAHGLRRKRRDLPTSVTEELRPHHKWTSRNTSSSRRTTPSLRCSRKRARWRTPRPRTAKFSGACRSPRLVSCECGAPVASPTPGGGADIRRRRLRALGGAPLLCLAHLRIRVCGAVVVTRSCRRSIVARFRCRPDPLSAHARVAAGRFKVMQYSRVAGQVRTCGAHWAGEKHSEI